MSARETLCSARGMMVGAVMIFILENPVLGIYRQSPVASYRGRFNPQAPGARQFYLFA